MRGEPMWGGEGDFAARADGPSSIPWGMFAAAAVFVGVEAVILIVMHDGPATLARWSSTSSLVGSVRDDPDSEAASQELYDRAQAGRLDGPALVEAAKLLWSVDVQSDEDARAGATVAISLHLDSPAVVSDDLGRSDRGPQLEWRLADVRWGCGPALPVDATSVATPLARISPTAWRRVGVPADVGPGPALLTTNVEFAVRARPGGAVVGRWRQESAHVVDVAPAAGAIDLARAEP